MVFKNHVKLRLILPKFAKKSYFLKFFKKNDKGFFKIKKIMTHKMTLRPCHFFSRGIIIILFYFIFIFIFLFIIFIMFGKFHTGAVRFCVWGFLKNDIFVCHFFQKIQKNLKKRNFLVKLRLFLPKFWLFCIFAKTVW